MLKFEIPMFYTTVFYIEGSPKDITRQVNQVMKKYGYLYVDPELKDLTKEYTYELEKRHNGRLICLWKDKNSKTKTSGNKAEIILLNTESYSYDSISTDKTKQKITTISHEIRHAVDKIVEIHKIKDVATPA